jgi:SAM-dependent methyltransferase
VLAEPNTAGSTSAIARSPFIAVSSSRSGDSFARYYEDWYSAIASNIPQSEERVLEIGSGGGFVSSFIPDAITSDVLPLPGIDLVFDAVRLPFRDRSLRAVVMTNVFHHLPDVGAFLSEFARCTRSGGTLVMIEPWVTRWARIVYGKLHHEPFDPDARRGNSAPVSRCRKRTGHCRGWCLCAIEKTFANRFPALRLATIKPMMPMRYLVSGGVSMRSLSPGWTYSAWKKFDDALTRLSPETAMFALIVVRRI